jgi:hypothetical protein
MTTVFVTLQDTLIEQLMQNQYQTNRMPVIGISFLNSFRALCQFRIFFRV